MIIIIAEFDEESYTYLIGMLNKRYYQTEDTQELKKINQLYKMILSILVYTFFSRMFDLMLPPVAKHSIVVA